METRKSYLEKKKAYNSMFIYESKVTPLYKLLAFIIYSFSIITVTLSLINDYGGFFVYNGNTIYYHIYVSVGIIIYLAILVKWLIKLSKDIKDD